MIELTNIQTYGWEAAFRGMRNPMNSWEQSDSLFCLAKVNNNHVPRCAEHIRYDEDSQVGEYVYLGPKDLKLAQKLIAAGSDHRKFMRQITVTMDVSTPWYMASELDTYKINTTRNSCSIQHKGASRAFTLDDFTIDKIDGEDKIYQFWEQTLETINYLREKYNETKDYTYFRLMRQLLPGGYNYQFTWSGNYEVLRNMYFSRRAHRLLEWHTWCEMIENLPYGKELICFESC